MGRAGAHARAGVHVGRAGVCAGRAGVHAGRAGVRAGRAGVHAGRAGACARRAGVHAGRGGSSRCHPNEIVWGTGLRNGEGSFFSV